MTGPLGGAGEASELRIATWKDGCEPWRGVVVHLVSTGSGGRGLEVLQDDQ